MTFKRLVFFLLITTYFFIAFAEPKAEKASIPYCAGGDGADSRGRVADGEQRPGGGER